MAAKQSLDELKDLAKPVFEKHQDATKVFATADGNIFLHTAENAARNHGRQEKLTVHEIARPADAEASESDEDADKD